MTATVVNYGGCIFSMSGITIVNNTASSTLTGSGVANMRAGDAVFDATTPGAIPRGTTVTSVAGNVATLSNTSATSIGGSDNLVQPKNGSTFNSLAITYAVPVTTGNELVGLAWSNDPAAVLTVSGTGWASAVTELPGGQNVAIFHRDSCVGGEAGPTFATSGGENIWGIVLEVAGCVASPLDKTGSSTGTGTASTATTGAPDSAVGDFVVGLTYWPSGPGSGGSTLTTAMTDSHGTAITTTALQNLAGAFDFYSIAWGVAGSGTLTTDDSMTQTLTLAGSSGVASVIASFKAAAVNPALAPATAAGVAAVPTIGAYPPIA